MLSALCLATVRCAYAGCVSYRRAPAAWALLAVVLCAGACASVPASGGAAGGGGSFTVTCRQQVPDDVGDPSGISVEKGLIVGRMRIWCDGTAAPSSYYFQIILVHTDPSGRQVQMHGVDRSTPPGPAGVTLAAFDDCKPGLWHIYYSSVARAPDGGRLPPPQDNATIAKPVGADEC